MKDCQGFRETLKAAKREEILRHKRVQPLISPGGSAIFLTHLKTGFTSLNSLGFAAAELLAGDQALSTDAEIIEWFEAQRQSIMVDGRYVRYPEQ